MNGRLNWLLNWLLGLWRAVQIRAWRRHLNAGLGPIGEAFADRCFARLVQLFSNQAFDLAGGIVGGP
ncbi:MAG TPA: hypothetical protein DEQ83_03390, partial [Rhodobiaceae bacterium]|nr:hypothetical protein [Rhodobiaceae bacterium]